MQNLGMLRLAQGNDLLFVPLIQNIAYSLRPLTQGPQDAVFSEAVTVTREK